MNNDFLSPVNFYPKFLNVVLSFAVQLKEGLAYFFTVKYHNLVQRPNSLPYFSKPCQISSISNFHSYTLMSVKKQSTFSKCWWFWHQLIRIPRWQSPFCFSARDGIVWWGGHRTGSASTYIRYSVASMWPLIQPYLWSLRAKVSSRLLG